MPKISVIVPVYNVEKYLNKCIESILNQTFKDFELILVDDGSPDNCGTICDEYAIKDNRIKVIHKENGGLSDARNAGLDIAKGKYIGFVDGDDYIDSTMYEKLYKSIVKNNADLAVCNFCYVDDIGTAITEMNLNAPIKDGVFTKSEIFEKLYADKGFYYITTVNKLYIRGIFENIRFPKGKINEDEFTAHYILEKCENISGEHEALYYYVQRGGSIMHTEYTFRNFDGVEAFFDRVAFAIEHTYNNLAFRSCLIGLSRFHFCYISIDKKDENVKIRIKELQKQYNDIYFKIIKEKNIPIIKRIVLTLYYFDLRNCVLVHKIYNLLKGKRTK